MPNDIKKRKENSSILRNRKDKLNSIINAFSEELEKIKKMIDKFKKMKDKHFNNNCEINF